VDYVTLGRTGLRASVIGLGGGGHSRIGQRYGKSEAESAEVVRRAFDLGINFFDTAEAYGTEPIFAKGLRGIPRDQFILSTKANAGREGVRRSGAEVAERVEGCLKRLKLDMIDIFHVHGVTLAEYDYVMQEVTPALLRLKEKGTIRWLGITENFSGDTRHETLQKAVQDDCWDVMMTGHNLLNPSARNTVFPATIAESIGTLIMYAVRKSMSDPDHLRQTVRTLVDEGKIPADQIDLEEPLGFLVESGDADSITEAAYRFCRYEPGAHVILSGTGSIAHLEENVAALHKPPLSAENTERLAALFGHIDSVSGQ
jgi:aryl-alcohol dehydrogenase-like predicted oxidoreductase